MSDAGFTWNLLADLQQMWSLPFMVNAFRAGSVVAIVAAVVGWFMVLRGQAFAGHTLSVVGFPGAAGAVWLGASAAFGYFAFCLAAALVIAAQPAVASLRYRGEWAVVPPLPSFALAWPLLLVRLYEGVLT